MEIILPAVLADGGSEIDERKENNQTAKGAHKQVLLFYFTTLIQESFTTDLFEQESKKMRFKKYHERFLSLIDCFHHLKSDH